jgi:hypothetical protein
MNRRRSVTAFARKHRLRAVATLVQIVEDPEASSHDRAQAANKLLESAEGRPGVPHLIDPSTVDHLSIEDAFGIGVSAVRAAGMYR